MGNPGVPAGLVAVLPGPDSGNQHWVDAAEFVPRTVQLGRLRAAAQDCRGCELYADATQTVFGAGARSAEIMLVGEQPGDREDRAGEPFVGPAGRVLNDALDAAGLDRTRLYVTNAVKHFHFRTAGKRRLHETPRGPHISACRPWLRAEASAVRPKLLVCLGATAVKSVLGNQHKVQRDRGSVLECEGLVAAGAYLITIHPSAVLRGPEDRRAEAFDGLVADLRAGRDYLSAA
jgi:DNA polymerase